MGKVITIFILLFTAIVCKSQTSYTWVGTTSTAWNTATNWSPNGVPDSTDNITLNTNTGNQPKLDQNRVVTNISITNGTLDLDSYRLRVKGTTTLTGGNVNNGLIQFNNTTTTVNGTRFGAKVVVASQAFTAANSIFNAKLKVTITGNTGNVWGGGNKYYDTLEINNYSTSGTIKLCNSVSDSINGHIIVSNTSSGAISFGDASDVKNIKLAAGKNIFYWPWWLCNRGPKPVWYNTIRHNTH